jgi:hypothetical protein
MQPVADFFIPECSGAKKIRGSARKNAPDCTFRANPRMREETPRHTLVTEAMTRFELVIKSFADPWLRPLTHIAFCQLFVSQFSPSEKLLMTYSAFKKLYIRTKSKHIP